MPQASTYKAILLDLDGTLVNDQNEIPEYTKTALRALNRRDIRVMISTGRSELATTGILEQLEIENLAIVYNGAGVYCPRTKRLVEERVVSGVTIAKTMEFARQEDLFVVVSRAGAKFSYAPRNEIEAAAISEMRGLQICEPDQLPNEYLIRLTLFSLDTEYERQEKRMAEFIERPVYTTSFPLSMLAHHRDSPMHVLDVHAPCLGKGEALRVLSEKYGIAAEHVVAVGDAMNDVPMLEAAGLGVAMQDSTPDVLKVADRVIGSNNSNAIGELVDELFGPA
ncbi:MAG: Cof subfamily protein (haloacid dehalogenase superfamily) [Planctomycetota bacterium]|jgi:Cof subfamily protein (haloacid dehalogenase superfamily)